MKRRDFLRTSSIAATTPLFLDDFDIDLDDFDFDFDGLTGGLFGSDIDNKDVLIEERIGHPPPAVSVSVVEGGEEYRTEIEVTLIPRG